MANNSIVASIGRCLSITKKVQETGIVINGDVYRRFTWDDLERMARTPGVSVSYHGTEARLREDWTEQMFRIFGVAKTGRYETFRVAVEA